MMKIEKKHRDRLDEATSEIHFWVSKWGRDRAQRSAGIESAVNRLIRAIDEDDISGFIRWVADEAYYLADEWNSRD